MNTCLNLEKIKEHENKFLKLYFNKIIGSSFIPIAGVCANYTYSRDALLKMKSENKRDVIEFIASQKGDKNSFGQYLNNIIINKGLKNSDVMNKARIQKGHFYQILRGDRVPLRKNVIKLSFVLGLSLEETDNFLEKGGHNRLYDGDLYDLLAIYCLDNQLTLYEFEILLDSLEKRLEVKA